jgi:acetyl esterase/lipase
MMSPSPTDPYAASADPTFIDAERVLHGLRAMPADQVVEPGVTAGDALAVMTTPPVPEGCVHDPDVVYGTGGGRPLSMHLYARADASERRPGVVFVHGGGFQEGFPEMLVRYANHLAARGYVTASIRYRLSGEAPWPACVEDAKCAVRWLRANAATLGLDPDRIGVAGNSAGGHIAAMVASTPGRFEGEGGNTDVASAVRAVVLWYPGTDLRPSVASPVVQELAAKLLRRELDDAVAAPASPSTYAAAAPPTLTFTGNADPVIPVDLVREYHRLLDAAGVANELVVVDGAGHSFDYSLVRWQECFTAMADWFDTHLEERT